MSHRDYAGIQYGNISEVLVRNPTDTDVVNTTTGSFLAGVTIPANAMGNNRVVRLEVVGDYLNNSGASRTLTITIMFGSSVLYQDSTLTLPVSTNRRAMNFQLLLANQGSTSSQSGGGTIAISGATGATTGAGDIGAAETFNVPVTFATTSEATNVDKLFMILVTHPVANASLSVRALTSVAVLL